VAVDELDEGGADAVGGTEEEAAPPTAVDEQDRTPDRDRVQGRTDPLSRR
jgi:hypothetical protein